MTKKSVLIIYYSYSGQTRKLLQQFAGGFESAGVAVSWQKLKPVEKQQFPLSSMGSVVKMMVETFFRRRVSIEPPEPENFKEWDLIILAGPTWSYNPSGPVLSFLDRWSEMLAGQPVLPLISCRGYWRTHYWQLKYLLSRCKAEFLHPVIFLHPGAEPWRTIGVFFTLAGRTPEADRSWLSRYYKKYGHTREQVTYAGEIGTRIAKKLTENSLRRDHVMTIVKDV